MRLCSYAWSSAPPAMRRVRWLLTLVFFVLGTIAVRPGSLLSVNPTGASPGVVINLTGTGFNTTAASNAVTFTPEGAGPALTAPAISVVTVNATTGTRRLGVRVPAGLPVGRVSLTVTNTGTGETASGASVDIVTISLPDIASAATGAQGVNVRILGSANANFGTGTRPVFGAGITVTGLIIESPTSLRATLSVAATATLGARNVGVMASTQSILAEGAFEVTAAPPPNQAPSASANGPYSGSTGQALAFSSDGSTDPDGDPLDFTWNFGDGVTSTEPHPQHAYGAAGTYTAALTVSDRKGGTATAQATVTVTDPVVLSSLVIAPKAIRFSEFGATTTLVVTGRFSDGTERDLTGSSAGTTYGTSVSGVVAVGADGLVTSQADGETVITATNAGQTASASVVVEQGVVLQSVELTPPTTTLREPGATAQAFLRGLFSDGSLRDLTGDPGTTFSLENGGVALVSEAGLLTAVAEGVVTLTGGNGGFAATAQVRVLVTSGTGFVRGEAFDDSRGLPLGNVVATAILDGGQPASVPPVGSDARGRFTAGARAGDSLLRIERPGFTTVERRAAVPRSGVVSLLDARLTPLDARVNPIQSVFGGEARNAAGTATVTIPAGSLDGDATLRVTSISNQGLQALLPGGWSPVAAVDLQPAGKRFAQGATLRTLHSDVQLPAGPVTLVMYDVARHEWIVQEPAQISEDGRTLIASVAGTGQYAFVVPDDAPFVPPTPVPAAALAGVDDVTVPGAATANGVVTPRSAPPGEGARASGTLVLQPPAPLPSGAVLRARVVEQFDLLDNSRVVPLPFVQDLVLYARPRLGGSGSLATRLPITPSLDFSIQQLSLGTVRLDVTADEPDANDAILGLDGGSIADAAGNVLEIPAGALGADSALGLLPVDAGQLSAPIPGGLTSLGAVFVDLGGLSLAQPALLSIPRPPGLEGSAQIVVAQVITDAVGGRRLKIVGLGSLSPSRISIQTTLASLTFEGVHTGGEFVFLRTAQPLGFITGIVSPPAGGTELMALVTSDTAPFAFVTATSGSFIVAGRAGVQTTVSALEGNGATSSGGVALTAVNEVASINLALAHLAPAVVATNPGPNAVNVALDAPLIIDFSKPIDPATVTESSVVLTAGSNSVSGQRVLSADRRRLTVTPSASLAGKTPHTLTLTSGVRDLAGVALASFTPLAFTTLDPSKPSTPAPGLIVAELPDEDGWSLITGSTGASEPRTAVLATNIRTQETAAVLSGADGTFRLRLNVAVGDELTLTLRDATGRESSIAITQFEAPDGTAGIGDKGGTIRDGDGRIGRILPRALTDAGLFRIGPAVASPPALAAPFSVVDLFALDIEGAVFRALDALTLTESQNRVTPATSSTAPFASSAQLTVPPDFLVGATLRFTAVAVDRDGARRSVSGATVVVASTPDAVQVESGFGDQFPAVYVTAPKQAIPTQVVNVSAVAPAARVDLDLPAAVPPSEGDTVLLARIVDVNGETKLAVADTLGYLEEDGAGRLRTNGRVLPGTSRPGHYVVAAGPVAFVTGRVNGPTATVHADGSPFIFETEGANGTFILPVPADASFTLRFFDARTGASLGATTGQAPAAGGKVDLGQPLGAVGGVLSVTAQPDTHAIVDIDTPLVFTFSEPVDRGSATTSAFVVTDSAGARAFGRIVLSDDGRTVTFVPTRRWKLGERYRYGVAGTVTGATGARLHSFTGEFDTFRPSVVTTVALGTARDVAVSGGVAVVGTDAALRIVDVAEPASPQLGAQAPVEGGVTGVALLPQAILTDRNGTARTGTFAVAVSGSGASPGRLHTFDVSAPSAAALLGSTQLTTLPAQTPPANVPPFAGIPRSVIVERSGRALTAIEDVGVSSVQLGNAIPNDSANPGGALAARYPAALTESATSIAAAGSRLFVSGDVGLTVLDAATLVRLGGAPTGGAGRGVAALDAFPSDVNGDGAVGDDEVFDLVLVANGSDGTLQLYRAPPTGDPVLLSVVRFAGDTTSVAADRVERLAYVGLGPRGLAIVDLNGAASVQPIDVDRNGVDDRVLGIVDTPGTAGRVAPQLDRGIGFVADGAAGLTVVQLLPPRTVFQSLLRDPIKSRSGDEEEILGSRAAFTTDEAIRLTVNAASAVEALTFLVEEVPEDGGSRRLALQNGQTSAALVPGVNEIVLDIARVADAGGARAILKIQTAGGAVLDSVELRISAPAASAAVLQTLLVTPSSVTIPAGQTAAQLAVGGYFSDGRVLNLTPAARGTQYATFNPHVATVDPDGRVTAQGGGTTAIAVTNGGAFATVSVRVDHPPALVALEPLRSHLTLRAPGPSGRVNVRAFFSDGSSVDAMSSRRSVITSSNPDVVEIAADGTMTARGEGLATITITNGALQQHVEVAVEFRTPAVVTAIELEAFERMTTDAADVRATARLIGTGSLDDLAITFSITGMTHAPVTARTTGDGVAVGRFRVRPAAGPITITSSVVNPADGVTLTASRSTEVLVGAADHEPNNDAGSAPQLSVGRTVRGTVDAASDPADMYRVPTTTAGTLSVTLSLPQTSAAGVMIVFVSPAGVELQRVVSSQPTTTIQQTVTAGGAFVRVEAATGAAPYALSAALSQAPVVVQSVSPPSGPPGTTVTIAGSGFSLEPRQNIVLFAGIAASVTSATSTALQAIVPANAVDGVVTVIVNARRSAGPSFVTGNSGPPPPIVMTPPVERQVRFSPALGAKLDVQRLIVHFDPAAVRADVNALAAQLGATIVGVLPIFNGYVLEFSSVATLRGLDAVRQQLRSSPIVARVGYNMQRELRQGPLRFDSRDTPTTLPGSTAAAGVAYAQARIFEALAAVRRSPRFKSQLTPGQYGNFNEVKVAVIDTGFDPGPALVTSEFTDSTGQPIVELFDARVTPASGASALSSIPYTDPHEIKHGTTVVSVIGALNGGQSTTGGPGVMTGALNGLFHPGETPFKVIAYAAADTTAAGPVGLYDEAIFAALTDIANRGDIDVVNMSFAITYATLAQSTADAASYRPFFSALGSSLLVLGAGNEGIEAEYSSPQVLAGQTGFEHVMAIGATGATNDLRAFFGDDVSIPGHYDGLPCDPEDSLVQQGADTVGLVGGSNCGPTVTLAAPGRDVFAIGANGYEAADGTSVAAPLVASIAALIRAITSGLTPEEVSDLLVATADDITGTWQPGPMRRLNALEAVRRVLPAPQRQRIYAADEAANLIIALEVDPITGALPAQSSNDASLRDREIPLRFRKDGVDFVGEAPRSLAMSPDGRNLYAVVTARQPTGYGDGVLVLSTDWDQPEDAPFDFIPFSGARFPSSGSLPPAVSVTRNRVPMIPSLDGRLLYVGAGTSLLVMNMEDGKPVLSYFDLPADYFVRAFMRPVTEFATRRTAIRNRIVQGAHGRAGDYISDLALSPDGKTLHLAFQTGSAGGGANGVQPGGVVAIDVDLYVDESPNEFGLQTNLSNYLALQGETLRMLAPTVAQGDEPSSILIGRDGRHVYLFHGGYKGVTGIGVEGLHDVLADYADLIGAAGFGLTGATILTGGLAGALVAMAASDNISSARFQQMFRELRRTAEGGISIMVAPGWTAAFDLEPGAASANGQSWQFPTSLTTGWNPPATDDLLQDADSGLIVNQFSQPEIYALRPMAAAMKPRGRSDPGGMRAIVGFGHTGNFGVLDLVRQSRFRSLPDPNPALAGLDPEMFHAFVGVTPSIPIGPHAIPDRGSFEAFGTSERVPSPDENFQNIPEIEYAQNGRFAVAAHAGVNLPRIVNFKIPEFEDNLDNRARLLELGFTYGGGDTISRNGASAEAGDPIGLTLGGGALSIISDTAIDDDFDAHLTQSVTDSDGVSRPYYSVIPICAEVDTDGATPVPHCLTEAVTRVTQYRPPAPAPDGNRFKKLRGIAIQPFAMIEAPRHADHVTRHTAVHVTWRDDRVNRFEVNVYDLDASASGEEVFVHGTEGDLTPEQQDTHAMKADFLALFPPAPATIPPPPVSSVAPFHNRRYRIEVHLLTGSEVVSTALIDVRYENLIEPVPPATRIDLSPTILPIPAPPVGAGQLSTMMRPNGQPPEDVTSQALYAWINGFSQGGHDLELDPSAVVSAIKGHLDASAGQPVDFGIVPMTVTTTGMVSLPEPGIQFLSARFDGIDSRPTVVLGGFTVECILIEPLPEESAFEHGTLGGAVATTFNLPSTPPSCISRNAPLVIAPNDSTFIDDDGQLQLDRVVLRYAEGGSIALNDLMDALRMVIEEDFADATNGNLAPLGATTTWRNAQALVELMEGPGAPSLNYELDFTTSNVSTAFVQTMGFFGGRVASNSAGLAVVAGTLDLGRLGTGADGVLVWSLPPIQSVAIGPRVTGIRQSDAPTPGPTIRSTATTVLRDLSILRPSEFATDQDFARQVLPADFTRAASLFSFDDSFGTDFRFSMSVGGQTTGGTMQFFRADLSFDVPNDELPQNVSNTYTVDDTSIVTVGGQERFTRHLVHQNRVGVTPLRADVTIDGLGTGSGTGYAVVCDCTGPVLAARLLGPANVQPGDPVRYEVLVLNPTDVAISNVTVTSEFRLNGALVSTSTFNAPTVGAKDVEVVPVEIAAPFGGGVLQLTVGATGFTALQPPPVTIASPTGSIVISEMVLNPQQDWNDSAGGNGTPFDDVPGNGAVDANDVWVEIMSPTTGTQNWVVRLTDATGATFTQALGPINVNAQVRVLSGFGAMTLPIRTVEVVDNLGLVRQTLDIQGIEQVLGPATGVNDESLTWSFTGSPTALLQQFRRRPSTIGVFLAF